ncbi:low-density lipoprotein receptor-related protein 8-like [Lampris incognitus]|uniref:low-density lipoprotein receptor-related protein 8-like n=1 Tax=Lampris incognitus TaxID=2546036 RepID=UPI0024B5BD9D|nr:low-density lipoprotein receptor-related protein 8-like [Lampris incognitus]
MGHFGGLFLLIYLLICGNISGHALQACQDEALFLCSSGRCVPEVKVCDGHTDCDDGTDELHCVERVCQEFLCQDGGCVARNVLCDGTPDCIDGSDETQDTCGVRRCKEDEFTCHNRRCVALHFHCDGVDDCGDGSDEVSCQNCTSDSFSCGRLGPCLPRNWLCNGKADCPDGQDEGSVMCPLLPLPNPHTCSASEFQCSDGECVPGTWKCDRSPDCSDGSDEENCGENECLVNNGGCSHLCVDQTLGFLCDCPSGMRLVGHSQCEVIDSCLDSDVCSQLCVHVNGHFSCVCHDGYQMSPKTGECKAKGEEARLVFSSSEGVRWISTTGAEYTELAAHLRGPGPMAAIAASHTLYLARQRHGFIYRVSMDGKPQKPVLVLKGQGSVSGLAVDWIHLLLYWTDREAGSINVALLDGSAQRLLIAGLDKPTAVAVEPFLGLLFWSESGNSPKIERASLDGQDRMSLVISSIHNPVAVCLDVTRQLLYWADRGMRTISRVDFQGRYRKTVVESNGYLDRPVGLAVFEGRVFWTEEVTRSVCSANKHNGSHFQVLRTGIVPPGELVLAHPILQPHGPAVCGSTGKVCQHWCIPDLFSDTEKPQFICASDKTGPSEDNETAITRTLPEPALTDPTFTAILSLIVFLSVLLVGVTLWWWREELWPTRNHTVQSFSLTESQDPLIRDPPRSPHEMLLKMNCGHD